MSQSLLYHAFGIPKTYACVGSEYRKAEVKRRLRFGFLSHVTFGDAGGIAPSLSTMPGWITFARMSRDPKSMLLAFRRR
jgi:hypothetical protein